MSTSAPSGDCPEGARTETGAGGALLTSVGILVPSGGNGSNGFTFIVSTVGPNVVVGSMVSKIVGPTVVRMRA